MEESKENEILNPILDCFSGADGGVSFYSLKFFLAEMIKRKDGGDTSAEQVVLIAERFVKLIEVSSNYLIKKE